MRTMVEKVAGFISVERFQSLTYPENFFLSLSSKMKLLSTAGATWPPIVPYNPSPVQKFLPITTCASVKWFSIMVYFKGKNPKWTVSTFDYSSGTFLYA